MFQQLAHLAITAVLALTALSAVCASTDKGLPVAGSMVALEATATGFEASIDVTSDDAYTNITVTSDDPRLKDLLSVDVIKTKTQPARIKRIGIHLRSGALPPGPYAVTIVAIPAPATPASAGGAGVASKRTPPNRPPERDVWLTLPALTLDTLPTTLVVDRICNGIYVREACVDVAAEHLPVSIASKGFQLWVSAQHRWLSGITVEQKGPLDSPTPSDGRVVVTGHRMAEGKLGKADVKPEVNPIFKYSTDFKLVGNFPLGTAKGKLSIKADQLAAPVQMDFEVRSRTTYGILVAALLSGLGLGWITRIYLKGRLDRTKEQQKTYVLIELIDAALSQTGDTGFTADLNAVRAAATDALNAKKADAIKTDTAAAQAQFLTLQAAISARRTGLEQSFADLRAVLQAQWKLPAALAGALNSASTALDTLTLTRPKGNFAAEEAALGRITASLLAAARGDVQRCAQRVAETAFVRAELLPLLDVSAPVALDALFAPGAKPDDIAPDATFSQRLAWLRAALNYVHVASSWTLDTLRALNSLLRMQVARWRALLDPATLPNRPNWKAWLSSATQLADALGEMAAKAGEVPMALAADAEALTEGLTQAIQAQFDPGDAAVSALLEQRRFADAIAAAAARLRRPTEAIDPSKLKNLFPVAQSDAVAVAPMAHAMNTFFFGQTADSTPTSTAARVPSMPFDAAMIVALAAASSRRLQSTEWWLSLTYVAIIVVGGYFLFKDKWVGTALDFAVAFFWAYASDIGSDAATAAARGLKK